MKKLISGLLCTLISGILHAAEINVFDESGLSYVVFKGEIERGDASRLLTTLKDHERYTGKHVSLVFLDSFGGSISEGVRLGETIEQNKLMTIVVSGQSCYSSCFLIFLSGHPRYAAPTSNIGVHRISENSADTTIARSLSIDLAKIYKNAKVPDSIRLAMLETAPNEIYTLSLNEKKSISTVDLDSVFKQNQYNSKQNENKIMLLRQNIRNLRVFQIL